MTEQGQRGGLVRLVDSAIRVRTRRDAMIGLVATAAALGADAEVRSQEPDGARWSIKITTP